MIKKKSGFTLIEVLLALAILAASSYILSGLQIRALLKLRASREFVERIYLLKKQLYLFLINPPKSDKPVKIESSAPAVKLVSVRKQISKKSAFAGISPSLYLVESTGTWKGWSADQKESMISFVYAPEPEKRAS